MHYSYKNKSSISSRNDHKAGGQQSVHLKDNRIREKENPLQLKEISKPLLIHKIAAGQRHTYQFSKKGKKIGAAIGGVAGGIVGYAYGNVGLLKGAILGGVTGAVAGYANSGLTGATKGLIKGGIAGGISGYANATLYGGMLGAYVGSFIGDKVTGRNAYSDIPEKDKGLGNLYGSTTVLTKGTALYHGTRWTKGEKEWWKNEVPKNLDKDDGGICFTRDPESTPKVRSAHVVIRYVLKQDVNVVICRNKGEFGRYLQSRTAVVYTPAEQEVRFNPSYANQVLQFDSDYEGRSKDFQV